jgi:hypothetical protein
MLNNPFDITTYNIQEPQETKNLEALLSYNPEVSKNPYSLLELPSTPDSPLKDGITHTFPKELEPTAKVKQAVKPISDGDILAGLVKQRPKEVQTSAFTYNAGIDNYYKGLKFNPNSDMEKLAEENQTTADVWGIQLHKMWDNAKNAWTNNYIGNGRFFNALQEGQFDNDAFFNTSEVIKSYLDSVQYDLDNPIYGKENASWYSPKGLLGDHVASFGFTAGGLATAATDYVVGAGLKAGAATGLGAIAIGLGITALYNNDIRETIGEQNANFMLGMAMGGLANNAIAAVPGAFKLPPMQNIPLIKTALRDLKAGAGFEASFRNIIDNTISNVSKGTFLEKASTLGNKVKTLNTLSKGLTAGLTGLKMYLSGGGEAGLEAVQAQYDYIGEKLDEANKSGKEVSEEEYNQIYKDSLSMSKDVYNLNRALLTFTNASTMGDLIRGSFARESMPELILKYVTNNEGKVLAKSTGSALKSWYKNSLKSSLMEGVEEGGQYTISEGSKEYLRKRAQNKSGLDSFLYGLEKTLTTEEGLTNVVSGILTGSVMSTFGDVSRGIASKNRGDTFKAGFTGYSEQKAKDVVGRLNKQFENIYNVTLNSDKTNLILDHKLELKNYTPQLQQEIESHIYDQVINSIETGTSKGMKYFIKDYFSTENKDSPAYQKLLQIYGSDKAIETQRNTLLTKFDKAESAIKNFTEFYNNPYTVTQVEKVLKGKKGAAYEQETKDKAFIYDTMVKGAARAFLLHDSYSEQLIGLKEQIKKLTENYPIDISPFITGNRNSYQALKDELDSRISTLEQTKTSLDKEFGVDSAAQLKELNALKKDLIDTEHELELEAVKEASKTQKEYVENSINPVIKFIEKLWNKEAAKSTDIEAILKTNVFKSHLVNIQSLEETMFFLSKDLKSFTSQKEQAILIDYIYQKDQAFKTDAQKKKAAEKDKKAKQAKQEELIIAEKAAEVKLSTPTQPITPIESLTTLEEKETDILIEQGAADFSKELSLEESLKQAEKVKALLLPFIQKTLPADSQFIFVNEINYSDLESIGMYETYEGLDKLAEPDGTVLKIDTDEYYDFEDEAYQGQGIILLSDFDKVLKGMNSTTVSEKEALSKDNIDTMMTTAKSELGNIFEIEC